MGVEHASLSRTRAPNYEVPVKVAGRPDLAGFELFTETDDEPTSRETSRAIGRPLTCHETMNVIGFYLAAAECFRSTVREGRLALLEERLNAFHGIGAFHHLVKRLSLDLERLFGDLRA